MTELGLSRYLQRIGYQGTLTADLPSLSGLVARHTQSIPFENLNAFMSLPVDLSADSVMDKLVVEGRGGYCYEQNALFRDVLMSLGFEVIGLAARVRWGVPPEVQTPASHMLLILTLSDVKYLVDVGFGVTTPSVPLRLDSRDVQVTAHGNYKITEEQGYYELAFEQSRGWQTLYQFNLEPKQDADYKVFNWYVSTHPDSVFVRNLVAARIAGQYRYTLRNREFKRYQGGELLDVATLTTPEQVIVCLRKQFNINAPEALRSKLAALFDDSLAKAG